MSGGADGISKTGAIPIEQVHILIQNQDEIIKQESLSNLYKDVVDCFKRTINDENITFLWRSNTVNVIRYFPPQAPNFAIKYQIKEL